MASPFLDTFLPSIAGSAAQGAVGYGQGQIEGQQLAAQLANQQAHTNLLNMQAQHYGENNPKMKALRIIQEQTKLNPEWINSGMGQLYSSIASGQPQFKSLGYGHYINPITGDVQSIPGMEMGGAAQLKSPFQQASSALGYPVGFVHTPQTTQLVMNYMNKQGGFASKEKESGKLEAQGESPVTLYKTPSAMIGYAQTGQNPLESMPTQQQAAQNIEQQIKNKERVAEAMGRGSTAGREQFQTQQEIASLQNAPLKLIPLQQMSDQLFTQTDPKLAALEGQALKLGAVTKFNPTAAAYENGRNAMVEMIGREMLAMKGVFTDRDIPRIYGAFPDWGDTKFTKDMKNKQLGLLIDMMIDAKKRGISGDKPDPVLRKRFEALFPTMQQEMRESSGQNALDLNKYYDSLSSSQQQHLDRVTDEFMAGKIDEGELLNSLRLATGNANTAQTIVNILSQKRRSSRK